MKILGIFCGALSLIWFGNFVANFQIKEGCAPSVVMTGGLGFVFLLLAIIIWRSLVRDKKNEHLNREEALLSFLAMFDFEPALYEVLSLYAKGRTYGPDWESGTKKLAGLVSLLYTESCYPRNEEVIKQLASVLGRLREKFEKPSLDVNILPEISVGRVTGRLTVKLSGGDSNEEFWTPVPAS